MLAYRSSLKCKYEHVLCFLKQIISLIYICRRGKQISISDSVPVYALHYLKRSEIILLINKLLKLFDFKVEFVLIHYSVIPSGSNFRSSA